MRLLQRKLIPREEGLRLTRCANDSALVHSFLPSFSENTYHVPKSQSMTDTVPSFQSFQLQSGKYRRRTLIGCVWLRYLHVVQSTTSRDAMMQHRQVTGLSLLCNHHTGRGLGATGHSIGGCQLEMKMHHDTLFCLRP